VAIEKYKPLEVSKIAESHGDSVPAMTEGASSVVAQIGPVYS